MNLTEQLQNILHDLQFVRVETALILGAIVLLITGLVSKSNVLLKSVFALAVLVAFYLNVQTLEMGLSLSDSIFHSPISQHFTSLFLLVSIVILGFKREQKHSAEFYFFILSMLIGGIFMMKANSLLVIYLVIELVSFSSYILTNFSFKKTAHEAGIKYLLFGAISSAIMLFGLGLIYGSTNTFFISEWDSDTFSLLLPQVGFIMMLLGIFFKASIVPMHIWVPATYQSAPNDAAAFMSIIPKLAAFVLLFRMIETTSFSSSNWIIQLSLLLGILTIIFGTLGALKQTNARRMISFGAIAHSGFLLPFAFMNSATAMESFWWYTVVYALMNLAIFYLLDVFERKGIFTLDDYGSLKGEKGIGIAITLVLVSLIGLPPLAGFTAKFFLFTSLWEFYQLTTDSIFAIYLFVAVFATIASLFFYLRIPYHLYISKSEDTQSIDFNLSTKIIATLFALVLLLLFFAPDIVIVMKQLLHSAP